MMFYVPKRRQIYVKISIIVTPGQPHCAGSYPDNRLYAGAAGKGGLSFSIHL
ncbi:MAG: hypothetical protein Q8904_04350 [Bacteroidota bacterium]|nr:hypothetical protein [Bacteroidota bacterium]